MHRSGIFYLPNLPPRLEPPKPPDLEDEEERDEEDDEREELPPPNEPPRLEPPKPPERDEDERDEEPKLLPDEEDVRELPHEREDEVCGAS